MGQASADFEKRKVVISVTLSATKCMLFCLCALWTGPAGAQPWVLVELAGAQGIQRPCCIFFINCSARLPVVCNVPLLLYLKNACMQWVSIREIGYNFFSACLSPFGLTSVDWSMIKWKFFPFLSSSLHPYVWHKAGTQIYVQRGKIAVCEYTMHHANKWRNAMKQIQEALGLVSNVDWRP